MDTSMSARTCALRSAPACSSAASGVGGVKVGTATGRPSPSTATKTVMHRVASVYSPDFGSADETTTRMCMLVRPVCTSRASTSTSSPIATGRVKRTSPT